jgi:RNA polymerase sigma factor (TIGR02999 family)
MATPEQITRILQEWQNGNRQALDRLMPFVYDELRTLASRQLAHEWRHNRLQTTAVVSEAYVKLFGQSEVDWQNRGHFFANARRGLREKHGAGVIHLELDAARSTATSTAVDAVDALALDRALQKLEQLDAEQARIVELRFFGGLTVEETAAVLGVSAATIKREWALAKGWLHRELTGTDTS